MFSNAQGAGWDCGASNGEGLSRVLATLMYPAELGRFTTAARWLDSTNPARPDLVNTNDPTDRNFVSTGCTVLFLNYLNGQLNYSWKDIVAAGAPTLAETYQKLTGATDGWEQFSQLIDANFPPGQPSGVGDDNPFPL